MRSYNSHRVIRNRTRLVERDILFDSYLQGGFLAGLRAVGMFSDVLAWDYMLHDLEWERSHTVKGKNQMDNSTARESKRMNDHCVVLMVSDSSAGF
jgi:hypothetical protein